MLVAAADCPPATPELRKIARGQLARDGLLLRLVADYQAQEKSLTRQLLQVSFVTEEGRMKALEIQSKIKGMQMATEAIFMLAEEEFTQDE